MRRTARFQHFTFATVSLRIHVELVKREIQVMPPLVLLIKFVLLLIIFQASFSFNLLVANWRLSPEFWSPNIFPLAMATKMVAAWSAETKSGTPHFFTFLISLTHHLSMVKFSEKNQWPANFFWVTGITIFMATQIYQMSIHKLPHPLRSHPNNVCKQCLQFERKIETVSLSSSFPTLVTNMTPVIVPAVY